jgi:hypothetical protein
MCIYKAKKHIYKCITSKNGFIIKSVIFTLKGNNCRFTFPTSNSQHIAHEVFTSAAAAAAAAAAHD